MTSLELCQRAIEFRKPERLPLGFDSFGDSDSLGVRYMRPASFVPSEPGEDEWGAVWEQTDVPNMGQMKKHPIREWDDLKDYTFPDPDDDSRYVEMAKRIEEEGKDKYIMVIAETVLTLWERFYSLRGFDQALMDLYLYPDESHDLLERILDVHIGFMKNIHKRFAGKVHGFLVSDDWGTQETTLIDVPTWRTFFKDRYQRLNDAIHDAGMHSILHSDGHINDLFEDIIEVGFDAMNLHSPTVVGIEATGRQCAGRIAFVPCIDIQNTLPRGTVEDVRNEARQLLEWWGTTDGGVLPFEYHALAVGAPDENVKAAHDAFKEFGMAYCGRAHQ